MKSTSGFHMTPSQFREEGKKAIDWIADYLEHIEQYPVLSKVKYGEVRAQLPDNAPDKGESVASMLKDLEDIIVPGLTHWQSPNFFAYFPANSSGPSIIGELISSGLGVQGMAWLTSPACTELETHVLDWLADAMDMPKNFKSEGTGGGVIQDTASSSSLTAMLVAREKKTDYQTIETGLNRKLVAYTSDQAHSSIEKAAMVAGIGRKNLRLIESDEHFAMIPGELEKAIEKDLSDGKEPFFISATVGTTSSNGMDPLQDIGTISKKFNLWLHVDAAMSGTAAICPEFRWINRGVELADSYCFNPHKWMFTNFDCDVFWVNDRAALIKTLSVLPEYLRNKATESGAVIDYRDWHIQLGRRFRALKLWFVLRHYGLQGLQHHIREHVSWAQKFAEWINESDKFELLVEPPLNLVCFRMKGTDEQNQKLLDAINDSGKVFLSHTKLNDKFVLRMSIGGTNTREDHVKAAWKLIKQTAETL